MRNFGIIKNRADYERKHTFNPETADPPYGDWPIPEAPSEHDRAANYDFRRIVLTALGICVPFFLLAGITVLTWLAGLFVVPAHGRDRDGRYANSPYKEWFDHLASGNGLCCSFADGFSIQDVDWDTHDGRYRVRLDGQWIDVPDAALVNEPNRFGPAVVWPYQDADGVTRIRCFLPGAGA